MLASIIGFTIGPAAIAELAQQLADRVRADRVAHLLKRFGEFDVALGDPQQRSHRIAQRDRLDPTTQILQQRWILGCQAPPPAPGPADPPGRWCRLVEILQPPLDGAARQAGCPAHRHHAAASDRPRFGGRKQTPSPLIQLVPDRLIPLSYRTLINHAAEYGNHQRRSKSTPAAWHSNVSVVSACLLTEREHARAVIVAEVDHLHWRIWNGKAKDGRITLERIRQVMPVFRGDGDRKRDPSSRRLWTALRERLSDRILSFPE